MKISKHVFDQLYTLTLQYRSRQSNPFPYVMIDNFFEPEFAKKLSQDIYDIPKETFVSYGDEDFEFNKRTLNKVEAFPESVAQAFHMMNSSQFLKYIEEMTGFKNVVVDEMGWGAGIHATSKGGYLAVHHDFNVLPTSFSSELQMERVLNIIVYLKPDNISATGGELELWENSENKACQIETKFNRAVLFDTRQTFHGHPTPYISDSDRISLANYYYQRKVVPRAEWKSTRYLRLPWKEETAEYKRKRDERANAELRYSKILKDLK